MPQAISAGAHERLRQLQGGEVWRPTEKEMRGTPFGCCRLSIALSRLFLLKPAAFAAGLSEKAKRASGFPGLRSLTPCRTGQAAGSKPSLRHATRGRPLGRCHIRSATWAPPRSRRRPFLSSYAMIFLYSTLLSFAAFFSAMIVKWNTHIFAHAHLVQ